MTTGERNRLRLRWILVVTLLVGSIVATVSLTWPSIHRSEAERAMAQGHLVEAETKLQTWMQKEPMNPRPRLLWASVARRLGRITEAEEALQRAMELGLPINEGQHEHILILTCRVGGAQRNPP